MSPAHTWLPTVQLTRAVVRRALARRGRGGLRARWRSADVLAAVMALHPSERAALGLSMRDRGRLWRGVVVCSQPWLGALRERGELGRALGYGRDFLFFDDDGGDL